jgi:hypothetical protein
MRSAGKTMTSSNTGPCIQHTAHAVISDTHCVTPFHCCATPFYCCATPFQYPVQQLWQHAAAAVLLLRMSSSFHAAILTVCLPPY